MSKLNYLLLFFLLIGCQTFGDREMVALLENGSTEECIRAIDKHPVYIKGTFSKYLETSTTVSVAAFYGRNEVIQYLLAHGADISKADSYGITPLHHAVNAGNLHTVQMLLDLGANVNSVEKCHLKDKKFGESPLSIAAMTESLEIVQLLIQKGANVNGTKPERIPPLLFATELGRIEIINLLLDSGADPLKQVDGKSILDYARKKALCSGKEKDQKIVEILEKRSRK